MVRGERIEGGRRDIHTHITPVEREKRRRRRRRRSSAAHLSLGGGMEEEALEKALTVPLLLSFSSSSDEDEREEEEREGEASTNLTASDTHIHTPTHRGCLCCKSTPGSFCFDNYVPMIVVLTDVCFGLASGMSVRFFPLFFMESKYVCVCVCMFVCVCECERLHLLKIFSPHYS